MVYMADLWLPILLSAIFVFIVSSVIHMVLPFHKADCKKLPGEERVLEEMRAQGVKSGDYMLPCPESMKDMGSPEMIEKYKQGPVGFLTVMPPGVPAIGKSLVQWFLLALLISVFVAYAARLGLKLGAETMVVFRMTLTVAILGHTVSYICDSIWKGRSWKITLKFVCDGVVYGVVTAATFALLWPDAV